MFRRDLTANELSSLRLIVKFRDTLPVSTKGIRRKLQTTTERGNFWSPMGILQRLGESVEGFQDLSEKIFGATGNLRVQLVVETLPAMLAAIEVIKEYHWSWTKQPAVVREITLKGESVRLLRELARKHFSSSVHWEEVYASVYLDPARLFPLAYRGELKKQTGLSDEAFLRWVLGKWEDVDLGQISWVITCFGERRPANLRPKNDECKKGRRAE